MKCITRKIVKGARTGVAAAAIATLCIGWPMHQAHAASAVISNGPVSLGILDTGNLGAGADANIPNSGVGLVLAGVGDAISPGCFCEGWGVAGNGISGYADVSQDGVVNLTTEPFSSTATTAISTTHLTSLPDLQVIQSYAPSVGAPTALFEDQVTIKNNSNQMITDIRYRRVMDWDIPPTVFDEFVTIGGLPAANLLYSNDNGFATANPLGAVGPNTGATPVTLPFAGTVNANFTDIGHFDQGSLFDFGFGNLAAGASQKFSIFYGATYNEPDAFTALSNVGAEVYALGQSSGRDPVTGVPNWISGSPGTYIFGFKGVGGTPISPSETPEPSSMALLGLGLAGIAAKRRNRKQS